MFDGFTHEELTELWYKLEHWIALASIASTRLDLTVLAKRDWVDEMIGIYKEITELIIPEDVNA